MSKYHFNPETGKTSKCTSTENKCPFIDAESPEQAQAQYEKYMQNHEFPKISNFVSSEKRVEAQKLPGVFLQKIPLKELNATQLSQTLRHEAEALGMDKQVIDSAIDLATILHSKQMRGNRGQFDRVPYIEHPLRNALRIIRWGADDQDVVVAAILHDTIEDGSKIFVKKLLKNNEKLQELETRKILGEHIRTAYGPRVLKLVEAVTNDYLTDTMRANISISERNENYLNHVYQGIHGHKGAYLVKISDFVDNATGLHHNDVKGREAKTLKQAVKYLPIVKVFEDELDSLDLGLSDDAVQDIRSHLSKTRMRLKQIIQRLSD